MQSPPTTGNKNLEDGPKRERRTPQRRAKVPTQPNGVVAEQRTVKIPGSKKQPANNALDDDVQQHLQSLIEAGYPNCAAGLRYAEEVDVEFIDACKWVRLAVKRHKRDLDRINTKGWKYTLDLDGAEKMMRNMQNFREVKGPRSGQYLQLQPWQQFIFFCLFAWVTIDGGYRRFRTAIIFVPRGNGKTTMAAPLALCMLALDGEGGAEVYSGAVTRQQARLVFDTARFMAAKETDFKSLYDIKISSTVITQAVSASEFRPLSRDANSMDGLNVYCAVLDELAQHKSREVYDVIQTATGKRKQSLVCAITTASSNQSGVGYEQWKYSQQVLENKVSDEQYFTILYTVDEKDDWTSEAAHRKANPNWNVSVMPEVIANLCNKAQQVPAQQQAFKQKHLNIWTSAATAWMNMQFWNKCADPKINWEHFTGTECVTGIDMASKIDLAARVDLFRREIDDVQHYYVRAKFWLPEATVENSEDFNSNYAQWVKDGWITVIPGEVIDPNQIEMDIKADANKFIIEDVAYDPWQALQMATNLDRDGIPVIEYRPTVANFSPAMKEVDALVREGRLHHDGNPVLAWCIGCTLVVIDNKDNIYPRKDKTDKTQKIDGTVGLLTALGRRMQIDADDGEGTLMFVGR